MPIRKRTIVKSRIIKAPKGFEVDTCVTISKKRAGIGFTRIGLGKRKPPKSRKKRR